LAGPGKLTEVGGAFLKLGFISFGGPTAHLGYFQAEFVGKRQWLDEEAYADLVALCQVLPGPTSSQVAFGLGLRRSGVAGALLASICFMLPSAAAMIAFAYGVGALGDPSGSGWLHGLRLAAVAVVALAVSGMASKLCPDWRRRIMAGAAAATILMVPGPATQVGVILLWAFLGTVVKFRVAKEVRTARVETPLGRRPAALALIAFGLLLLVLPPVSVAIGSKPLELFDSFFRSGALVFGGGHVVLPLLRSELVPRGWISDSSFLAGYGAVQAVPGPLFTFAAYLGTMILAGPHAWWGGVLALFAIFLPGWLLIGGAYPFWHQLRSRRWFQGAVRGASVGVVGVLFAALCTPLASESIRGPMDAAAALGAIVLLTALKLPQWALVLLMAAVGQWILR
jgi:chromate transporter